MEIIDHLTLDLEGRNPYRCRIYAKQGDSDLRKVCAVLTLNGEKFIPAPGLTARVRCHKADGHFCVNDAVIQPDGTVLFTLSRQMLACSGMALADLALVDEAENVVSSSCFTIEVLAMPLGEELDSTNEFQRLEDTIRKAEDAHALAAEASLHADSAAEDAYAAAEAARKAAAQTILDPSLSNPGQSAQAAAVGDRLRQIHQQIGPLCGNLYHMQTEETIDPHYYVNGIPYAQTTFDKQFHCTGPIPADENTVYTLGLLPGNTPWGSASQGVFFYDSDGVYLSGTTAMTFTTPAHTSSLRFNFDLRIFSLAALNAGCMLFPSTDLPDHYIRPSVGTLRERLFQLENPSQSVHTENLVYYRVEPDGIYLHSGYSSEHSIRFRLARKGGNQLFDFDSVSLFRNDISPNALSDADLTYLINHSGDWHSPYGIRVLEHADGDNPNHGNFTGGNHQYNNTGSGSTATARSLYVHYYADGRQIRNSSGYARRMEIRWANRVQASNTTRSDGTGREVLEETHSLTFDGTVFQSETRIRALEALHIVCLYGFQMFAYKDSQAVFLGAAKRGSFPAWSNTDCGSDTCDCVCMDDGRNAISMSLDQSFDLGRPGTYQGTKRMFSQSYGKIYCNLIANAASQPTFSMNAGDCYGFRGAYRFYPVEK